MAITHHKLMNMRMPLCKCVMSPYFSSNQVETNTAYVVILSQYCEQADPNLFKFAAVPRTKLELAADPLICTRSVD
jgi:hypothetical protein